MIREKELAFDAQLSATEIVRRCERRIGELVREGQKNGTIRKQGQSRLASLDSPKTVSGVDHTEELGQTYAMADAPTGEFEQAVADAREEGNLSRAAGRINSSPW